MREDCVQQSSRYDSDLLTWWRRVVWCDLIRHGLVHRADLFCRGKSARSAVRERGWVLYYVKRASPGICRDCFVQEYGQPHGHWNRLQNWLPAPYTRREGGGERELRVRSPRPAARGRRARKPRRWTSAPPFARSGALPARPPPRSASISGGRSSGPGLARWGQSAATVGEGGSRPATAPRLRSAWARRRRLGAGRGWEERGARHGAGLGLEADVVAVLPVPAGHRAVHAGALGAYRLQYPSAGGAWPAGRGALGPGGLRTVSWGCSRGRREARRGEARPAGAAGPWEWCAGSWRGCSRHGRSAAGVREEP